MANGQDWILQSASFVWIFTLLLSESQSKKTQIYYMEGTDCGGRKQVGGAVVYSHLPSTGEKYPRDIDCQMTFEAEYSEWKLMLRVLEMDIPDRTASGLCNDALYVYDDSTFLTRAMEDAGGAGGLCGDILPVTLKSTGKFLTVGFKTNGDGAAGRGFKFIVTAYSDDHKKSGTCGSGFECDNKLCIADTLTCDGADNCGDYSDEAATGRSRCNKDECAILCKFLSLGVTASIFISVGSIVIVVSCVVALVCCCRRTLCRKSQDLTTCGGGGVVTTATAVVANGTGGSGGPCVASYQGSRAPSAFSNHAYSHQGYYPMQPVYPTPHGSLYSYAKDPYAPAGTAYAPAGSTYAPAGSTYAPAGSTYAPAGSTYAPAGSTYAPAGSTYAPAGSTYSSQPSQYRPYTPTSSKSGKSNKSNNSTSVTYSQGTEKVSLPVNL